MQRRWWQRGDLYLVERLFGDDADVGCILISQLLRAISEICFTSVRLAAGAGDPGKGPQVDGTDVQYRADTSATVEPVDNTTRPNFSAIIAKRCTPVYSWFYL